MKHHSHRTIALSSIALLAASAVALLAPISARAADAPATQPATQPAATADGAVVCVYDIRDLIDHRAGWTLTPTGAVAELPRPTPAELSAQVIGAVRQAIDPDRKAGPNSVRELRGHLIVATATQIQQAGIDRLIGNLRKNLNLQVQIEVRLMEVESSVLRKLKFNPVSVQVPGQAAAQSAKLALLNGQQVEELLKKAMESSASRVMTAPRLTVFNGQMACVQIGNQTAYTSGYKTTQAQGQVKFDPQIATITEGFSLQTRPVVSADGKSVALALHPRITTLHKLTAVPAPNTPPEKKLMIQQPQVEVEEVELTAAIPADQTLLVEIPAAPTHKDARTSLMLMAKVKVVADSEQSAGK